MFELTVPRMGNVGGYNPIGWVSPIQPLPNPFNGGINPLDAVSLDNEISDAQFFGQLQAMRAAALQSRMSAVTGQQPLGAAPFNPYAPTTGSDADFFQQLAALKQEALRQAAQSGRTQKPKDQQAQAEGGRLSVTARGIEREGKLVPVKSITIHEVGNWKNRDVEQYWDSWDSSNQSKTNTFDRKTKPGAYYQINVTWADGTVKTVDRQMPMSGDLNETIYNSW